MRSMLLSLLLAATCCSPLLAQEIPQDRLSAVSPAERHVLLNVARTRVLPQMHQRVRFVVKRLVRFGDWALLHATMQGERGQPISYAGTRYEEADRRGQKSHSYDALLLHTPGGWIVRVDGIGATEVPWTNWSTDFNAPTALFQR